MEPIETSAGLLTVEQFARLAAEISATTEFSITLLPGQLEELAALSEQMEPTFRVLVAALIQAASQIGIAFGELVHTLDTTATKITDWATAAEATQRDRVHGRAAICPRHGPTRGGTCMRCQR